MLLIGAAALLYVLDLFSFLPTATSWRERAFKARLSEAFARGDVRVPISSLTTFAWDRVCYVHPYDSPTLGNDERRRIFASLSTFRTWWVGGEGSWGLLFSAPGDDPTLLHLSRSDADLAAAKSLGYMGVEIEELPPRTYCLGRDEAVLVLVRRDGRLHVHFTTGAIADRLRRAPL